MIDSDFYNRYIKLGNLNKSSLWKELHATFISHPEVVAYASSARGVRFGSKYLTAICVRKVLGTKKRVSKGCCGYYDEWIR
ncbi:MAG: hypothetical protein JSY10_30050 [Paenibacillus sp.]|nr:hypothetical protein [Paenibacillus sp.]